MLIKRNKIPVKEIILIGFLPGFIKKAYYRFKGYKIGKNVSFGFGSVVIGEEVIIGDNSTFGFVSVVRAKRIDIGRFVRIGTMSMLDTEVIIIGDDSRINENVIIGGIRTPDSLLKLGKRVIIMEYSFINPTKPVIIGDDSGIGGHCLLFTHGSWLSELDGFPVTFAPITIGANVWLPWRVFIMPGVSIGDEVVIGANSLVSKDLPANVLAAGSPAKIIIENYPTRLSKEKKNLILDRILNDFINHLEYNDIDVMVDSKGHYRISGKKIQSEIKVLDVDDSFISSTPDSVLVLNCQHSSHHNAKMILNIEEKTRIGSSKVGEELVKFVSRYGIRFNRLD